MTFEKSLNSGWIKKLENKKRNRRIFNISWTIFCLIPVVAILVIETNWFINYVKFGDIDKLWINLWNFTDSLLNNWWIKDVILFIAIVDFFIWSFDLFKIAKSGSHNIWISIALVFVNLMFVKLITINASFILIKALWDVGLTFAGWIAKIIRLNKEIKITYNYNINN